MSVLELRRVSKVYGQGAAEVHALDRVTLSVDEGAMVAVMEPGGGMAAVVVTHDAHLAAWADRVIFPRDGRITDQTAPAPGPGSLLTPGPPQ